MNTFGYTQDGNDPLTPIDMYKVFNDYRIWKYLMRELLILGKTHLSDYRVLEPGCATGEKLRFLTEYRIPPRNCYGFDISERGIELGRRLSPESMHLEISSIFEMPFRDVAFDIVICSGFFCCFRADEDLRSISRILKKAMREDGVLFAIDINENFSATYRDKEAVMKKGLRSFNSTTGELERLLEGEFVLSSHRYIFGSEYYCLEGGNLAEPEHLPYFDQFMDQGKIACTYSLWTFLNRRTPGARLKLAGKQSDVSVRSLLEETKI